MIFDGKYLDTYRFQALRMMEGASEQIAEFFPSEGSTGLVLSGIVFRPATDEDIEEEGIEPDLYGRYVFEAHFYAKDHPMIGSTSTKLLFDFSFCETYEAAVHHFYREIHKSRCGAYPPEESDVNSLLDSLI